MPRKLDRFTTALTALVVIAALLACKKKTPVPTAPSAEPVAAVSVAPTATEAIPAADAAPKLGEVKRYADKEKAQTGVLRVLEDGVKVFNEADDKTPEVATLPKDLRVSRIASIQDWELVEFPSGVGKVSPGWVLAKLVDSKAGAAAPDAVAQAKPSAVPTASAAPKASVVASAKPVSTAKPVSSATAAKAAADKAAADKAAADKAAADKAAADKVAADKAAADKAASRAARVAARAAARAKAAADAAAAGK